MSKVSKLTRDINQEKSSSIPSTNAENKYSLVKCDFSYSCAAAGKISTDLRRRAVPLR